MLDSSHNGGIQVVGYYGAPPSSVVLPGSMATCSTNLVKNTSGQTQMITVTGGTVTAVCWRSLTYAVSSTYTFPVEPGDSYGVTYSNIPNVFQVPLH